MKFRVEHDALAEAVGWIARALPSRPVVPVLSGLRLTADDDGLTLSCFDYEVSATARTGAEVAEPGTALVPGRLLAEITRSLPGQPAEFAADGDMVSLNCGSAEFELVALPLDEYPALPDPPPLAGTIDGGDLAVAIGQVLPAASRDDTLPMLTGICLDIDGDRMALAATDRYRLAVREVGWSPASRGLRAAALVPARTLADMARSLLPGVPVTIAFAPADKPRGGQGKGRGSRDAPRPAEGMISFESGQRRLATRLIGGEFVRYQSRFPDSFGCRAEIPAASFTEAVRRVSLVADRASPVRLAFGPGKVTIEARTEGRARAVETVTASFHGDQPEISFNPHYLLDGLAAAAAGDPARHQPGGEEAGGAAPVPGMIRLDFTSPAKPALVTWAGGDPAEGEPGSGGQPVPAFRYLVVPLRAPVPG